MKYHKTPLQDAVVIELEEHLDERGSFARLHCQRDFQEQGLPGQFVQSNLSVTKQRGVLRGMHFQKYPSREGKLVRCLRGSVNDVIIDLRADSPTYQKHYAIRLDEGSRRALYVPYGFAHGFLTLEDNVEVLYEMTDYYDPQLSTGVRWDDPAFNIDWPDERPMMNERDRSYPDFTPDRAWVANESSGA